MREPSPRFEPVRCRSTSSSGRNMDLAIIGVASHRAASRYKVLIKFSVMTLSIFPLEPPSPGAPVPQPACIASLHRANKPHKATPFRCNIYSRGMRARLESAWARAQVGAGGAADVAGAAGAPRSRPRGLGRVAGPSLEPSSAGRKNVNRREPSNTFFMFAERPLFLGLMAQFIRKGRPDALPLRCDAQRKPFWRWRPAPPRSSAALPSRAAAFRLLSLPKMKRAGRESKRPSWRISFY